MTHLHQVNQDSKKPTENIPQIFESNKKEYLAFSFAEININKANQG